jgi:hypothetical protein
MIASTSSAGVNWLRGVLIVGGAEAGEDGVQSLKYWKFWQHYGASRSCCTSMKYHITSWHMRNSNRMCILDRPLCIKYTSKRPGIAH